MNLASGSVKSDRSWGAFVVLVVSIVNNIILVVSTVDDVILVASILSK